MRDGAFEAAKDARVCIRLQLYFLCPRVPPYRACVQVKDGLWIMGLVRLKLAGENKRRKGVA